MQKPALGGTPGQSHLNFSGTADQVVQVAYVGTLNLDPSSGRRNPIPRTAPAATPVFTNRTAELQALTDALEQHPLLLLDGEEQVGKTHLVARWAATLDDQFPHGTVYYDLSDYGNGGQPDLLQLLGDMLTDMEVSVLPSTVEERHRRWLSVTRQFPPLVIIDNINDPALLRLLRPAENATMVLISRFNSARFMAEGVVRIPVAPFTVEHSRVLAYSITGADRWTSTPDGDALLASCGGRPRTVSLLAGCLATQPELTVAQLLREISEHKAHRRVDAAAAIAERIQIEALATDQHELYRQLTTSSVMEFGNDLAAHLAGRPSVEDDLRSLHTIGLIDSTSSGRWRIPQPKEPDSAVMTRVVDWYRRVARIADQNHTPDRLRVTDREVSAVDNSPELAPDTAIAWFETELSNLVTVQQCAYDRGWDEAVMSLEESLWVLYLHRSHPSYRERTSALAVAAARRWDNPAAESRARGMRSRHLVNQGDHDEAMTEARTARRLARIAENSELEASAFEMIARIHAEQGQWDEAKQAYRHSLAIYLHLGDSRGKAVLRHQLAKALTATGEYVEAAELLQRALMSSIANARLRDQANVLLDLGRLHMARGETDMAIETFMAANTSLSRSSQPVRLSRSLEWLGDCYRAANDIPGATAAWQHAVEVHRRLRNLDSTELERLETKLAELS